MMATYYAAIPDAAGGLYTGKMMCTSSYGPMGAQNCRLIRCRGASKLIVCAASPYLRAQNPWQPTTYNAHVKARKVNASEVFWPMQEAPANPYFQEGVASARPAPAARNCLPFPLRPRAAITTRVTPRRYLYQVDSRHQPVAIPAGTPLRGWPSWPSWP